MRRIRHLEYRPGRLPALGFAAAALVAAWVPVTAGETPLELRLAPPAGKVLRYQLDNQTDVNYQGVEVTTITSGRLTVARAADAENGNLLFDVVIEKLEASRRQGDNLDTQDLGMDGAKVKAEVTARGAVVKIEPVSTMDEQQQKVADNFVDAVFFPLPDKPVKKGDTWNADLSKPDGSRRSSGEFTLDDVTKKEGGMVAKISGPVTTESTTPPLTGKGTYEATVAVQDGCVLTSKASVDFKSEGGPSAELSLELKLVE